MNDTESNLLEEDQSHQQEDTQQDGPGRTPLHAQPQKEQVLLGSWSTLTTRLLTTTDDDAADAAWNVLDEPLGPDLAVKLNKELAPYWSQLRPAKTQGEVLAKEAMQILSRHRFFQQNHDNNHGDNATTGQQAQQQALLSAFVSSAQSTATSTTHQSNNKNNATRGDRLLFLPYRNNTPQFDQQFPHVMQYIRTVQRTVQHYLGHALQFDFDRTSLQLAEYPVAAGYPAHCDVSGQCCCGAETTTIQSSSSSSSSSSMDRILTVLYYLTPADWQALADGGCLRIHHQDKKNATTTPQHYTNVVPYANRMVIFRSDRVKHQVMPSRRRPRRALTLWLYGKERVARNVISSTSAAAIFTAAVPNDSLPPPLETTTDAADDLHPPLESTLDTSHAQGPPPLPINNTPTTTTTTIQQQSTIFVSIAAFRDTEVVPTLQDLRSKAAHPDRIFVGVVLQVTADDNIVLPTDDPWYNTHVRTVHMHARHAKGPCPARAMAQLLYRTEDYCLQIDAHMRFRQNWDTYLIQELAACPTPSRALLTTYPVGYQLPNHVPNETRGTFLYPWKFDDDGMLRQKARYMDKQSAAEPICCSLFAAGFCFGPATWLTRDCPYDGTLHDLFFGEEMSVAIRLYTAGYDLYAPRQTVCFHLWSRAHRPAANPIDPVARRKSLENVRQQIMPGLDGDDKSSSRRSVQDWAAAIGVDLEKRLVLTKAAQTQPETIGADVSAAGET